MFRFATYAKLGLHNLTIVGMDGREYRIKNGSRTELDYYFTRCRAIGFYFQFPDKYHPVAHAFFCKLSGVSEFWAQYCPVSILLELASRKLLTTKIFPPAVISTGILDGYLRFIARNQGCLGGHKFTPHSLRIGGHTFFSIKNIDADFLHFLGRRAISRVCQLYYRARAYDNLVRLNMFFRSICAHHILQL